MSERGPYLHDGRAATLVEALTRDVEREVDIGQRNAEVACDADPLPYRVELRTYGSVKTIQLRNTVRDRLLVSKRLQ